MSERKEIGLFANTGKKLRRTGLPKNVESVLQDEQTNYVFFVVPENGQDIEQAVVVQTETLGDISGPDGFQAARGVLLADDNSSGVLYKAEKNNGQLNFRGLIQE